ncbi:hypothetical protein ASG01_07890 [Chryseobacterium sp. Leaf180]|jgi:hypothetical protein|uniref:hypothetical protein n=1 Tax=Chryseobacterium sp. Leaf180 TaxID=1736289 RepID=UPI0006F35FA7|nr:hypothetical protein [Chryseobacterium sp. Leaf180]KQR93776.1 hypothetical protein ASG01_07890 [Chryseobacterium sp. Leaf180]
MKKKWLISVSQGSLESVAKELRKQDVQVLEVLDMINVIIAEQGNLSRHQIKSIIGVENVEEENNVSI